MSFSIVFPLFPAMLGYYLGNESSASLLGEMRDWITSVSNTESSGSATRQAVLFGGILGSLYSILQFLFAPFWGGLSDRVGRRPVLLVTILGITVSYVLWFFSSSFTLLLVARFLGGMMGGNISVATAAVADCTTRENRSKGMAIIGVAFGLGFILGPALGGALSHVDLRVYWPSLLPLGLNPFSAVAGAAAILSTANFLWVYRSFRETLRDEDRGKAREERRTINPIRLFKPLDLKGVNAGNLIWFFYLTAFSGMEFTLTFLATDRFQYTTRQITYLFLFSGLIIAVVQGGMVRQLAPLYGEKALLILGLALVIPGFALVGWAPREGALYLGLGLMALGSAFVTPSASALVSLYTPSDRQGSVLGIFRSLGALARAVGPILGCTVYWQLEAQAAYLAAAVLLLLPLGLTFLLPPPLKNV